jgi:formylglycine-generating enzyme required for sulfatase activity
MNENILCRIIGSLVIIIFLSATSRAVVISTVPVGYPGNAAEQPGDVRGSVGYNYRIGTYDVTNAQYVEFLNAKASVADPYGLWNSSMDPSKPEGAVSRTSSAPYSYSVRPGYANRPVVNVSWYDGVRFVNWLTNGQGSGNKETGSYTIASGGNDSGLVTVPDATQRAAWAAIPALHWLMPTQDEWYKAHTSTVLPERIMDILSSPIPNLRGFWHRRETATRGTFTLSILMAAEAM